MKRVILYRSLYIAIACLCIFTSSYGQNTEDLKLKDYRPKSIYKVPVSNIVKAKYPAIEMHVHACRSDSDIIKCIKTMDACGIEKAIILSSATGSKFDNIMKMYSRYPERFEVWCGFDNANYNDSGYWPEAVKELERCYKNGAKGVGELMFKGKGVPPNASDRTMMLPDDPREDLLFEKCAELGMPVNIHVSEDQWMYEKNDSTNDGLINAATWQVKNEYGAKSHQEMLDRFENTLKKHPKTTFIAAHLSNCCSDLSYLGNLFDKYPNLYADIAARFGEIAPIPRFAHQFIEKYQDRLVYGTDMTNLSEKIYGVTYRILETSDEHFYELFWINYHWPLYGLSLSDGTLKKLYKENALKIIMQ